VPPYAWARATRPYGVGAPGMARHAPTLRRIAAGEARLALTLRRITAGEARLALTIVRYYLLFFLGAALVSLGGSLSFSSQVVW
jgi:hypothetical protein